MCTVCGCGIAPDRAAATGAGAAAESAAAAADAHSHPHGREHAHDHEHDHSHDHGHPHAHDHRHDHHHPHHHPHGHAHAAQPAAGETLDYSEAPAGLPDAKGGAGRLIRLERDLLEANNRLAAANRNAFKGRNIFTLNLVSSPGSGKTTLLVKTILDLRAARPLAVIEGDQQTSMDAERIRATGVRAVQINTGAMCHLDARMIGDAYQRLSPADNSVLFIENVGNLVCPAGFDLGEAHKVVLLSVTEGEEKPLKYPAMFYAADLLLLTKVDLLAHVAFDVDRCLTYARQVNPGIDAIAVSATRGDGLAEWYQWLERRHAWFAVRTIPATLPGV
ncbi:MAG: hydrogenase nickel incorporation protein HypB [Defluviicoccus sp.]